jgi:hypothetical protein
MRLAIWSLAVLVSAIPAVAHAQAASGNTPLPSDIAARPLPEAGS